MWGWASEVLLVQAVGRRSGGPQVSSSGLPWETSWGALLAPPLLQGSAHPHGYHSGISVIELHDERVTLWQEKRV